MIPFTTEQKRIAAYQVGWSAAQNWLQPNINPYLTNTESWLAWNKGYEEGGIRCFADVVFEGSRS